MNKYQIFLILILTFQFGCNPKSNSKEIKSISQKSKLSELYKKIANGSDKVQFNAGTDNILTLNGGSVIEIPRGTFLNTKQIVYTGDVILETIEALDFPSAIVNNLSTYNVSGQILTSNGMLYIKATTLNGENLTLKNGITISMPINSKPLGWDLYNGDFSELGEVIWQLDKTADQKADWYTIPLDQEELSRFFELVDSSGKTSDISKSFIATNEFIYGRMSRIEYDSSISRFEAQTYLDYALSNQELFKADSVILDSNLRKYNSFRELYSDIPNQHLIDLKSIVISPLNKFYNQKKGKPQFIENYGIDLSGTNAFEELIKKGLDPELASGVILTYRRGRAIKQSRSNSDRIYYTFRTNNLGWINVDKLYNSPKSEEVTVDVTVEDYRTIGYAESFLVVENDNVVIKGYESNSNGTISFTQENEKYSKLPIGEDISIVTLAYKDNLVSYNISEAKIEKEMNISVKLKEASLQEFKDDLGTKLGTFN
jgi:hypothetical protein